MNGREAGLTSEGDVTISLSNLHTEFTRLLLRGCEILTWASQTLLARRSHHDSRLCDPHGGASRETPHLNEHCKDRRSPKVPKRGCAIEITRLSAITMAAAEATWYDKRGRNYLAGALLACMLLWSRRSVGQTLTVKPFVAGVYL